MEVPGCCPGLYLALKHRRSGDWSARPIGFKWFLNGFRVSEMVWLGFLLAHPLRLRIFSGFCQDPFRSDCAWDATWRANSTMESFLILRSIISNFYILWQLTVTADEWYLSWTIHHNLPSSTVCLSIYSNLSDIPYFCNMSMFSHLSSSLSTLILPFWVIACDVHIGTAHLGDQRNTKDGLDARCDLRPSFGTSLEARSATAAEGEALAEFLWTAPRPVQSAGKI